MTSQSIIDQLLGLLTIGPYDPAYKVLDEWTDPRMNQIYPMQSYRLCAMLWGPREVFPNGDIVTCPNKNKVNIFLCSYETRYPFSKKYEKEFA